MVDPFAPPADSPARTRASAPDANLAYQQTYDDRYPATETRHDRSWRSDRPRAVHTEPARPGLFWVVAAVGIGLLCLARFMLYFAIQDNLPNDQVAPALFAMLGTVALAVGLCLAAVMQRGLATGWRVALLLGAGFFATLGSWPAVTGLF